MIHEDHVLINQTVSQPIEGIDKDSVRTIYLIRHGAIQGQGEEGRYIGRTDLPLTKEGKHQALGLKEYFRRRPVTAVFTSPLIRCIQTAKLAFPKQAIIQIEELIEQNCGQWENLTFSEVKERYPEEYRKRGEDLAGIPPLGGENLYDCLGRMMTAIHKILAQSQGDIAIVAHSTMNRVLLAKLQGLDIRKSYEISQAESCINRLRYEDKEWTVEAIGERPHRLPDDQEIQELLDRYGVSQKIKNHMKVVAEMAEAMRQAVLPVEEIDRQLLRAAACLHDIARDQKNHEALAKEWLEKEGYLLLGEIISQHHDLDSDQMSAAFLLNLADKYCLEDRVVTLEDRFSKSREKCRTQEALQCHHQRYRQALAMEQKFKNITGIQKEIPVWFRERRKNESDF